MKKSLLKNKNAWIVFIYDLLMALLAWIVVHGLVFSSLQKYSLIQFLYIIISFSISIKIYRTYASLWKTVSAQDLRRNIYAVALGSVLFFSLEFFTNRLSHIARSEIVFFPVLTLMMMLSGRFFYRQRLLKSRSSARKKMIVIGAGDGAALFLRENESLADPFEVLALFDDDNSMHGKVVRGVSVIGSVKLLCNEKTLHKYPADEVLIAIPSISSEKLQSIYKTCLKLKLPVKVLPSLMELTHGAKLTDIKEVAIEDLLGRDPVAIQFSQLSNIYDNKVVLVTGGAGSIGSEIAKQLLIQAKPKEIIIYDHSEFNLYSLERSMIPVQTDAKVSYILASILDLNTLENLFKHNKVDIVFHAAAYKHVPILENQIDVAIQNNILGTKYVVDLSNQYNIDRFLLVSTDKAVNPTNVMGATKRIAELYVNSQKHDKTKFIVTRFGNVLGSTGSVIPLFKEQLKKGGPITVTHPDIERYFMTIPEASLLVILSCAIGSGGETYVLEMGKPIKIKTLAEQLITLSGKEPYIDIDIEFTGLRQGEKMYEELFYDKELLKDSGYDKLKIGSSTSLSAGDVNQVINLLKIAKKKEDLFSIIQNYI